MITGHPEGSQSPRPILIDTDPGIDDALALFPAWGPPGPRVEAITTVAGNVPVDMATANVFRLLDAARPRHRPRVARGAAPPARAPPPLRHPLTTPAHVHGDDGLGNLGRFTDPDGRARYPAASLHLEMQDGADLILETADRFGADLGVVAVWPLTNVALAL